MKTDSRNLPYRYVWERLLPSSKRISVAQKRKDLELLVCLVEGDFLSPHTRLSPLDRPKGLPAYIDNGFSLLHECISQNETDLALRLLEKGCNPNIKTFFNETPLHYAARKSNKKLMKALVLKGGDPFLRPHQRGNFAADDVSLPKNALEIYKERTGVALTLEDMEKEILQVALPLSKSLPLSPPTPKKM